MINVLLIEDHPLFKMGVTLLLEKAEGINLVGVAEDGIAGIEQARALNPDVILMDIGLPSMDGIEATKRIKSFNPDIKILIFTSKDSERDVFESFKSGADGYIMKEASPEQTINAIKSVNEGVCWIDAAIAKMVLSSIKMGGNDTTNGVMTNDIQNNQGKNIYGLTMRELEVLALMVNGLTNPEIAEELVISRATAKAHVHSILQKLCVGTRTQATRTALTEGLVKGLV
ncbi:response regulator transcription factor [bacterium]|nr:response regulator transcription factor [bacterium]